MEAAEKKQKHEAEVLEEEEAGFEEPERDGYPGEEVCLEELEEDRIFDEEEAGLKEAGRKVPAENQAEEEPAPTIKHRAKSLVHDLIFYALLIFVCIYILPNFVIQRTIVDGSSMADTLHDGEHLYVEKLSYRFDALDRFDIIVFYPYGRDSDEYYVKRIIGLPGETVQIIGGQIYINNELLEEHYGKEPILDPGRAAKPVVLGDDEYFVMGDNRNVSKDSRVDVVGNVKKENIGGRVIFRIKPLSKFGTVD